jgi:hypothetical protein
MFSEAPLPQLGIQSEGLCWAWTVLEAFLPGLNLPQSCPSWHSAPAQIPGWKDTNFLVCSSFTAISPAEAAVAVFIAALST